MAIGYDFLIERNKTYSVIEYPSFEAAIIPLTPRAKRATGGQTLKVTLGDAKRIESEGRNLGAKFTRF